MQNNRTLAQRTLLNWRFWVILPVTLAMLPLGLVSLAFPFNINWYARAVNWAKTKNPYNNKDDSQSPGNKSMNTQHELQS